MNILIIADLCPASRMLATWLGAEGFRVTRFDASEAGLRHAIENSIDVIVLDVALTGPIGYSVLTGLRENHIRTAVMVLAAASDTEREETYAFDLGADGYLRKPFAFAVLVARLRALSRQAAPLRQSALTAGTLSLDPRRHCVHRAGVPILLTRSEFRLLEYLMRRMNTVATKTAILEDVWNRDDNRSDHVVEAYVSRLRYKIDLPFGTNTIKTHRGVGYRLAP